MDAPSSTRRAELKLPTTRGALFLNPASGARQTVTDLETAAGDAGLDVFHIIAELDVSDFARDLGVPTDWREALHVALSGTVRQIDPARGEVVTMTPPLVIAIVPRSLLVKVPR